MQVIRKTRHKEDSGFFGLLLPCIVALCFKTTKIMTNALFEGTKNDVRSGEGKQDIVALHPP